MILIPVTVNFGEAATGAEQIRATTKARTKRDMVFISHQHIGVAVIELARGMPENSFVFAANSSCKMHSRNLSQTPAFALPTIALA
jgi:hypothetical protein